MFSVPALSLCRRAGRLQIPAGRLYIRALRMERMWLMRRDYNKYGHICCPPLRRLRLADTGLYTVQAA